MSNQEYILLIAMGVTATIGITILFLMSLNKPSSTRRHYSINFDHLIFLAGFLIAGGIAVGFASPNQNLLIGSSALLIFYLILLIADLAVRKKEREISRKITVVPSFNLKDFKIYEVGILVDGKFNLEDVIATISYCILHKDYEQDEIEKELVSHIKKEGDFSKLYRVLTKQASDKERKTNQQLFLINLTRKAYSKFVKQGYFRYNPLYLTISLFTVSIFILAILRFTSGRRSIIEASEEFNFVIVFLSSVFAVMAVFAHSFHKVLAKTVPLKQKILGYKMYLKTVEYYRVHHDEEVFKKYIPYLLSFGLKKKHTLDMLKYVEDKFRLNK